MNRIFLIGLMGSGKSHWGKKLASALNWEFVDLDRLIEEKEGLSIAEIFSQHGETHFRAVEKKYLGELSARDRVVVAAGGGTPCFYDNMQVMNSLGDTYYLKAKIETIVSRLQRKKDIRPLLKGKEPNELPAFFEEQLKQREPFYLQAKHAVEEEGLREEELRKVFWMEG